MKSRARPPVVLVPGIINPGELSYGPLIEVLKSDTNLLLKELEVYGWSEVPPPGYRVMTEAEGIVRVADEASVDSFDLVGYSAGGIAALCTIERYGERLRSVTLIEPFGTGSYESSPVERAFLERAATVLSLPLEERVAAFLPLNLGEGVEPPAASPGPPPVWMRSRPLGLEGLINSAIAARFDHEAFRGFRRPVYVVIGSRSNPAWYAMSDTLSGLFPNIKTEVYEGLHHLNPPQRVLPERFAGALREIWAEGDALMERGE
jgi:pimeloyl-ACP methyl ester carboxylesterase